MPGGFGTSSWPHGRGASMYFFDFFAAAVKKLWAWLRSACIGLAFFGLIGWVSSRGGSDIDISSSSRSSAASWLASSMAVSSGPLSGPTTNGVPGFAGVLGRASSSMPSSECLDAADGVFATDSPATDGALGVGSADPDGVSPDFALPFALAPRACGLLADLSLASFDGLEDVAGAGDSSGAGAATDWRDDLLELATCAASGTCKVDDFRGAASVSRVSSFDPDLLRALPRDSDGLVPDILEPGLLLAAAPT
mmetsp:Transcript_62195/g.157078  ORF Transcript_62195/g.157078 Transcript_62195/m.157078 type:complete len:252 (-) Transcript_62195:2356-3111(-)